MKKGILSKWMVGLTSVAAFIGFIGMVKNYDNSKQALPKELSSHSPTADASQLIKQEWINSVQQVSPAPTSAVLQNNRVIPVYQREDDDEYEDHKRKSKKHHDDEHKKNEEKSRVIPQPTGTSNNGIQTTNTGGSSTISTIPPVNPKTAKNPIRTRAS